MFTDLNRKIGELSTKSIGKLSPRSYECTQKPFGECRTHLRPEFVHKLEWST